MNNSNKKRYSFAQFKKDYGGIVWCIPVLLGILIFTLFPMGTSLYWSLGEYRQVSSTLSGQAQYTWKGLANYVTAFTNDWDRVFGSFKATFLYALVTIPTGMIGSYALALFLNQKSRVFLLSAFSIIFPASFPPSRGR